MKTIRNWILLLLAFWGVNAQAGTKPTINCSRSGESVIVTWGCSDSTLDHYVLYCTGNPAGGYTKSMGLATSYTDSQADSTTTWTYYVEAWFTDGTTEQSATVSTSGGGGGGGGGFPITASDGESTEEVYITWEAVSGAASYRVIRGTSSNRSKATILGMVPATDSFMEYIDTPPVAGTVYYYWIMAQDSSNTGFLTSSYDTGYRSDSSGGGGGGGGGNGMHTETVGGIEWTYVISNNTAWVGGGYVGQIGLGSTYPAVPAETSGSLTIPSRLGGYPVVGISKYAFYSTSMTSVSIPDSVTDISKYAFVYCRNLASVSIGSGATNIPGVAFYHESTPASFTVASGNPAYASRNGMLLSKNGKKLVRGVDQTTVAVPDGVTHIVDYAFHECSGLTSIEMPDSVTYIGSCAFADCSGLTSVTIGNGVTSIGVNAFRRCSGLSSLVMPNSVRSIGAYAFADCTGMTSITLGNGLTFIGQSAFWNCPMLTSVTIPDRVTTIGNWAFDDCSQLATISIPPWLEDEKDNWSLPGRCQVIVRSVSTIKFNSAGGSSVSSITATIGSALTAPTPPTKADYVFVGWSPAFPATMPRYGATLTAQWALAIRTVTLDRQGGSGGTASVIAAYGEALPSIAVPTRTGYTFDGYYTAANGGGTQYYTAAGAGVRNWNEASATTLYAKWTGKPSTVTFDPQGGSGGSTSATAVYGSAMPSITLPTRTGYAFGGYYTAKNGGGMQYYKASGASARNWDKTAATTLYAKWTAKTYTLTFDANGGTHSSSAQTATATYDGALPDCVPAPTNDDWAFSGWASDQAGTSLWYGPDGTKLLSSYTTAADTTLYAVWKPATPVIVPADGTILSGSQSVVISCATAGATIHFTTNGAVPTAESPTYRRFRVSQRMTVKAVAVKNGIFSAVAVAEYALGRCADPVITPADGTAFWHSGLSVSIAWSGEDGVLRYTLDGSEPAKTSPVYRGAFTIDETTVVKARAFGDQFFDSAVVTATLTRGWRSVATPVVRAAAAFTGSRTPVEIDCATPGAKIRFTTDGSTPDSRSPRYAGRFHVADSCTVKAYAVLEDYDDSAVTSFAIEKILGIGDTMGDPDRTFATGGNLPFFRVADSSAPSGESMKSGAIAHNGTSTLSTTVDGPGTFSFRWKTSCEDSEGYYDWDRAEFRVDGALAAQLDGQTDWRTFSRAVSGAGPHALEWRYVKDDMGSEGQDCCWVADFSWAPSCTETTEVPVPYGWLLGFYPDTPDKRDSYEAAAKASAANGKNRVWECYVTGTSPTDASDQFLAEIVMDENGNPRVIWTPDLGGARDYVVEGKASLADDWGAPDADSRFFRVHVAIPEYATISFDSAGGSEVAPISAIAGTALRAPASPTKEGYTFAGWSPSFPGTMPAGGAALVALWTPKNYTITFDSAGGSAVASITAPYGSSLNEPADPTKSNWEFGGWSPVFPATMPLGGAALTAVWITPGFYKWTVSGNGVTITGVNQTPTGSLIIPSKIDGHPVTGIGPRAFNACSGLTSVSIPDSVTNVGDFAFYDCSKLSSVVLGNGVTSIGNYAFYGCSLLETVSIPDNVTSIGNYSFCDCSQLSSVMIEAGVSAIGVGAFSNCSRLTSISVSDGNPVYATKNGLLMTRDEKTLVAVPAGLASVTIPDGVTSIGACALNGCSRLTTVTIPNGVTTIGITAFSRCSGLTSVVIPAGVSILDQGAFSSCSSLTSISFSSGSNLRIIGNSAFSGCSKLASVTLPNGVMSIGDMVFANCYKLTEFSIPSSMTSVGSSAFANSGLTSISIPVSLRNQTSNWGLPSNCQIVVRNEPQSYAIRFDSAGGTSVAPIVAAAGAALTAPTPPTKQGCAFAGWSPAFPSTMPVGGATLVAQWSEVDANGSFGRFPETP